MCPRAMALVLALALATLAGCAGASRPPKPRDAAAAERDTLSAALNPLLTAAGLWHDSAGGCPAAFAVVEGDVVGLHLAPHAPCRVKLIVTEATLGRLDRATLTALLAHEVAHLQLGHPDARQARGEAREATQRNVRTARRAGGTAAGFIPGVGPLVSKAIGTAGKAQDAAAKAEGNPYLADEEVAADALAVKLLASVEGSSCRALVVLVDERPDAGDEAMWARWRHDHPASRERTEAFAALCPQTARR